MAKEPSDLILALQRAKFVLEVSGRAREISEVEDAYRAISKAIYALEEKEALPFHWRDCLYREMGVLS